MHFPKERSRPTVYRNNIKNQTVTHINILLEDGGL